MKTKLRSLTLSSFRSFVANTKIELPESGLVLVQGPSGAGKSSINLGIAHAFGFCPYPGTELQSWFSDEPFEVEVEMDTSSGPATLSVGKRASLQVGGEKIQSAKAIRERMDKLLGIDPTLLAALTYRPQKQPGLFLSKTNSEMQDFLSVLLGLGKYEVAMEIAKGNIFQLEAEFQKANNRAFNAQTALKEEEEVVLPVPEPVEPREKLIEAILAELKMAQDKLASSLNELNDLRGAHDLELGTYKKIADKDIAILKSAPPVLLDEHASTKREKEIALHECEVRIDRLNKQWEQAEKDRQHLYNSLLEKLSTARIASTKVEEVKAQIKKLEASQCAMCGQPWAEAGQKLAEFRIYLTDLLVKVGEIPLLTDMAKQNSIVTPRSSTYTAMVEIRDQLRQDIATHEARNVAAQRVMEAEWRERMANLVAKRNAEILRINENYRPLIEGAEKVASLAKDTVTKIEIRLTTEQDRLQWARKENLRLANEIDAHEEKLRRKQQEHLQAAHLCTTLQNNLHAEQDWLQLLKHFMASIFDEVLEEIAYNTNKMLASVPNVDHVTLRFKSEVVTAKGKVNKAIVPVLTIAGAERPLRSALSGGMATAVELAVDLAVRRVISARTGAAPGWLILDECFEGLGLPEKEACMELLKREANDTLILVIDHMSEFKEMFGTVLTVENEDGRSRIA